MMASLCDLCVGFAILNVRIMLLAVVLALNTIFLVWSGTGGPASHKPIYTS